MAIIVIPNFVGENNHKITGDMKKINELNRHFVNVSEIVNKIRNLKKFTFISLINI